MSYISQYFKELLLLLFAVEIVNLILPDNKFYGYVKFVSGLLILTALIVPLTGKEMFSFSNIYGENENYEYEYNHKVKEIYESKIENDVKEKFNLDIKIYTDDNFNITHIESINNQDIREAEKYLGL